MRKARCLWLILAALLLPACALGEYDAETIRTWLSRFCEALPALELQGDPAQTADPARPGEYLLEYTFGTVTASVPYAPKPEEILEIDVRTQQVTDCRGMRVGMTLSEVTGGQAIGRSSTQLYVLSTQDAGLGFAWAYLGEGGVYGVEHITYGGEGADVFEYTLTYVLSEKETVSAIRVRCVETTMPQAEQAMRTAEEIAQRQRGEVYAVKNAQPMLAAQELEVMGVRALGLAVSELVAALGEPLEVQTLPEGQGRLLLYEGAAITLGLEEMTGEEVVTGVSVSGSGVRGPRGLSVGMSVQEAASLFRCDEDVYAVGGVLYREDEGHFGELICGHLRAEAMIRYAAAASDSRVQALEINVREGTVTNWRVIMNEEGPYGGF